MNKKEHQSKSLYSIAWERLKRNRLAMIGVYIILLSSIIALLGGTIRPDGTKDANNQILSIPRKAPGFEAQLLKVKKNRVYKTDYFWNSLLAGGKQNRYKEIAIYDYWFEGSDIVVEEFTGKNEEVPGKQIAFNIADVVYSIDTDQKYEEQDDFISAIFYDLKEGKQEYVLEDLRDKIRDENIVTKTFWLGTDGFGRDVLSRLLAGTIVSLSVGLISVMISLVIGMSLGAIGGYYRGRIDDAIMWLINVVWSIPTLLLVIAITIALGKGFMQVFIAVGLTMWVEVARIVRGQVLAVRENEFVEAGKALGYKSSRIIIKHVLPNVMGPVIVISAANFASAILIEAGLSFLGIGAQIPTPSWGSMIKDHYTYITTDMAHLAILPGVAIMILVLAFMLIGNGLRDAFDSKAVDKISVKG